MAPLPNATKMMIDNSSLTEIRRDMMKFAHLQLRDETLAEDVVQEALAAALSSAKEFAGRSALKTWVFAILRNKIIDQIRLQSRTTNVSSFSQQEESLDETFETLFNDQLDLRALWPSSSFTTPQAAVDAFNKAYPLEDPDPYLADWIALVVDGAR